MAQLMQNRRLLKKDIKGIKRALKEQVDPFQTNERILYDGYTWNEHYLINQLIELEAEKGRPPTRGKGHRSRPLMGR